MDGAVGIYKVSDVAVYLLCETLVQ